MPEVVVGHIEDTASLDAVTEQFEKYNPGFRFGRGTLQNSDTELLAEHGGVRHLWIQDGEGEVFLPEGYRTREGDGDALPDCYVNDGLDEESLEILDGLAERIETVHEKIRTPVEAILDRRKGDLLAGDAAGETWLMIESGIPKSEWSGHAGTRRLLDRLLDWYTQMGWSTKTVGSWEPIIAGDQLTVAPDEIIHVRGEMQYWWIEHTDGMFPHTTTARRIRYLRDTAGGCNFAFDAFRRLPLTWYVNTESEEAPDGINTVNSHLVNIPAETSQTHYHPATPVGGGKSQCEIYFVMDPSIYQLSTHGRQSYLHAFPDLEDLSQHQEVRLRPGQVVFIPPGTGHRGVDVFVNVLTLPGFKPLNEIYIDRLIYEKTQGQSPYNEHLVDA